MPPPASQIGEAVGIVVAAVGALGHRRAAELAAPDDQRGVQQAAGFQVREQGRDRLVDGPGVVLVAVLQVAVLVPAVAADRRTEQLDEAHAALDQPPGDQALAGEDLGRRHKDRRGRKAAAWPATRRRGPSARARPFASGRPARSWRSPTSRAS